MNKAVRNVNNDLAPILLVEDDEIDARYIERTLSSLSILNPLIVARDGIEALDLLFGANDHPAIPKPVVVILDLNMPRMGGWTFLSHLRGSAALNSVPVVIFTTSNAEYDKQISAGISNDAYFIKGDDNSIFKRYIKQFFDD